MRYRWALLFVVLVVTGALGSAFVGPGGGTGGENPPAEQLLRPSEAESYVWPYTSRSRSVEGRTLALNVVIVGTPEEVRTILTDRSELEWTEADEDHDANGSVAIEALNQSTSLGQANESTSTEQTTESNPTEQTTESDSTERLTESGTSERTTESDSTEQRNESDTLSRLNESIDLSPWRSARGSSRYTYVADNLSSGQWVKSEYQLATGTYLGSRTHIRAYPGPSDNWTALQAHTEYWDWFRLRHSVTGVESGGRTVERDLRDEPFVAEVNRVYHGHSGGGSDGWMSVIRLTSANWTLVPSASAGDASARMTTLGVVGIVPAAAVFAVAAAPMRRRDIRDLVFPAAVVAIVLGVRSAGIAAEGLFPAANPKIFAGILYPILISGPFVASALLARNRPATRMALLAAAGLGTAFVLDWSSVGVSVIPIRLVLHRFALVGVFGLFTLGVASEERPIAGVGVVLWLTILAATLLGMV
ncbi:hypothetical protein [Halobellus salinisoli]|uniref:hypothetical protein n=1 Tax=Halobellus salinisoli TaxID=3108500 RepID=UPI00300A64DD